MAYQVYPKSFLDTTGNGFGDIRGIIQKLDYLKELGVDIIWVSPCYVSPLADEGYDIADYYKIDPRFGTNEDMFELFSEAKKRDMYVILDLVVNHCSDEHPVFQAALKNPYGPEAKYFFFEKGVDGHEPNNWRSYFGGSVWEKVPGTDDLYYLHLFHKKQPDLNWENPQMRQRVYRMINWWLDRGAAGFRLDAIMNIKKELPLRGNNYEPDRDDGMAEASRMIHHAKGIGEFLGEMRDETFRPHQAFSVGEVFDENPEEIEKFIGEDGYFSSMFDFRPTLYGESSLGWYAHSPMTPDHYKEAVFETQERVGEIGMMSTIIENHDEPRGVSYYIPAEDLSDTAKKFLATMQFMQKGLPFIYQGQEIGMENCPVSSISEVDDVSAIDQYHVALEAGKSEEEALRILNVFSRDNARTPMQWDSSPSAGFTAGTPWLHVNPNHAEGREGLKAVNVADELKDPDSVLHYYQRLIRLRKDPEYADTVVYGAFEPYMKEESRLMAFFRRGEGQTLLVIGNFRKEPRTVKLPGAVKKTVLSNLPCKAAENGGITLSGYQAVVLEMA